MAKKKGELTEAELDWFELGRYDRDLMRDLDVRSWAGILEARVRLVTARFVLTALKEFKVLALDPLSFRAPHRFLQDVSKTGAAQQHRTDTPSVRFLRVSEIRDCATAAKWLEPQDIFSLEEHDLGSRRRRVVVDINLGAAREQIGADFNCWLNEAFALLPSNPPLKLKLGVVKRRFTKDALHRWVDRKYLPYFDLNLFASLKGKSIPPDLVVKKLKIPWKFKEDPLALLKGASGGMKIFTAANYLALRAEAEAEQDKADRLNAASSAPKE